MSDYVEIVLSVHKDAAQSVLDQLKHTNYCFQVRGTTANFERLYSAALKTLGDICDALNIDDGNADPEMILDAIEALTANAAIERRA